MLDEAELSALNRFFIERQGRFGTFSFVDPWTRSTIPSCTVEQDSMDYELAGEMLGRTSLVVLETKV